MELLGKTALITGASKGIGKAIAHEFAKRGIALCLVARNFKELEKTAREIRECGAEVVAIAGDIGNPKEVKRIFKAAFSKLGGIDILVNNAGVNCRKKISDVSNGEWNSEIQTNLTGVFLCSKEAREYMKLNNQGWIVNISSIKGKEAASSAGYTASKAGVIGLTKSLAKQFVAEGIFVNCVAPGFIDCGMTHLLKPEELAGYLKKIPLGRVGRPEEIAKAVAFLCSEEASYIVGATLDVNGGYLMT